ncbi:hypothetical protein CYMTET_54553 [Cymbomonas tetramitiformis]|uniref:Nucleoside-diphosphate kinase n=1 Tax=Cymbomonas tetramitiformis TaxID=36881 RepID=A0AAE0BEP2_9CHLO|nr:hypothetical protein CYMTET_54553 [Cymbomonas tetramitiformis]
MTVTLALALAPRGMRMGWEHPHPSPAADVLRCSKFIGKPRQVGTQPLSSRVLLFFKLFSKQGKMVNNTAFVFIKPHAVTDPVKALVKEGLVAKGLNVLTEGTISSEEIDSKMLIDQHYYAIASKATLLKPNQLNVPSDKFEKQFGLGWQEALDKGLVYNALDGSAKLGIDADTLDGMWGKAKKAGDLVKFGGGFYCAKIQDIYIFNGFFMSMRSKFVAPGCSIYYFVVEWDAKKLSWESFRGTVLGPTDPAEAPADSLRGQILAKWQELGLKSCPDTGDNGVHASASPFEALAERMNWLGAKVTEDSFGKELLAAGISEKTLKEWSVDPQVTYGPVPIKASLFDSLEDTDSDYCLALCTMMSPPGPNFYTIAGVVSAFIAGAALVFMTK